jgi:hypothetical protein
MAYTDICSEYTNLFITFMMFFVVVADINECANSTVCTDPEFPSKTYLCINFPGSHHCLGLTLDTSINTQADYYYNVLDEDLDEEGGNESAADIGKYVQCTGNQSSY